MLNPNSTDQPRIMPDPERLSMLAAALFLSYGLTRLVALPSREWSIAFFGTVFSFGLDVHVLIAFLSAGLVAAGSDWVLHDHPALSGRSAAPYWLLPALFALVMSLPLNQVPYGLVWWLAMIAGGSLLLLVLVGEYVSLDPDDLRQPLAAAALIAVAFAVYLVLASSLVSSGVRLYLLLPGLMLGAGLVSLRAMHLRLHGQWLLLESGFIALIIGQIGAALYYWPLSPLAYGALLLGSTYALFSLMVALAEDRPLRQALIEPGVAIALTIGVAVWLA